MGNFAENLNLGNRFRPPLGSIVHVVVLCKSSVSKRLSIGLHPKLQAQAGCLSMQ